MKAASEMTNAIRVRAAVLALGFACAACLGPPPGQMRRSQVLRSHDVYRAFSWGKADVTLEAYTQTAFDCAARAVVSDTDGRQMDAFDILPGTDGAAAIVTANQAVEYAEAQAQSAYRQRQVMVEACLAENGYRKFGLTEGQLSELDGLLRGTQARRVYLHEISSDAGVLAAQGL
ncbi:MAG: hypothetical protein KKA16_08755 [Alphaproteobacteria bacterium]|nr:hypothetical protein [Alphaproteobacteria bacterium]